MELGRKLVNNRLASSKSSPGKVDIIYPGTCKEWDIATLEAEVGDTRADPMDDRENHVSAKRTRDPGTS